MVSVAFTRQSLGLASQFNAFAGYEVLLTEEGGVAAGPSAASSTVTRLIPVLGESRFSTFTVSPAFNTLHDFSPEPVRWPYVYAMQSGFTLTVRRLDLTTAGTASATAGLGSGSGIVGIAARAESPYGYILRSNGEVRRWTIASGTGVATSVIVADAGRDFEGARLDASGNLWLGQDFNGYIQKRDAAGALIFEVQVPAGGDLYSNFVLPDGLDGALVLNQRFDAGSGQNFNQWLYVDGSGAVADITSEVTVDGDPWDVAVTGDFGGPGVHIGSFGNRLCFNPEGQAGVGTDLLYGVVTTSTPHWSFGHIGWRG